MAPAQPYEVEEQTVVGTSRPRRHAHTVDLPPTMERPEAGLVVLTGPQAGKNHPIGERLVLGRSTECQIRVEGSDVSRQHAEITVNQQGEYILRDLGSRNGTFINGIPQRFFKLHFGDRISVGGDTLLLFTHRDRLNEQLLHQQRMEAIGRLAGGVAHDFNNLLGAITANIEALTHTDPNVRLGAAEVQEMLQDVETAAQRAAELTNQLLGFARRGKYQEVATNMTELCSEVVRMCRRTFGPTVVIDEQLPHNLIVKGDRSQLHQVLMNLLINARDSLGTGGRIEISANVESRTQALGLPNAGQWVVIRVRDDGSGMTPETMQRVFEPFFTTKELGRGTGLGLATAYGIIKNHGGEIEVESQLGHGACFSIYLPESTRRPGSNRTEPCLTSERVQSRARILLVDDDPLVLRGVSRLLQDMGYEVFAAANGDEALAIVQTHGTQLQLVLLDVMMPNMDGETTHRALQQMQASLPVVAMSGYSDNDRVKNMLSQGARSFLQKPFDRLELARAVGDVLGEKRAPNVV